MSGVSGVGGAGGAGLWSELIGKFADKLPPGAAQQAGFDSSSSFGVGGEVDPAQSKNMLMNMLAKLLGISPEELQKMLEGMKNGQGAAAASEGKGAGAAQGGGGG